MTETRMYLVRDSWCEEHEKPIVTVMIEGRSAQPKPLTLEHICVSDLTELFKTIGKLVEEITNV